MLLSLDVSAFLDFHFSPTDRELCNQHGKCIKKQKVKGEHTASQQRLFFDALFLVLMP